MPSFQGINTDCDTIIAELCNKLREQFKDRDVSIQMDFLFITTKYASENDICLSCLHIFLLTLMTNVNMQANIVDPDQPASVGAV